MLYHLDRDMIYMNASSYSSAHTVSKECDSYVYILKHKKVANLL